MSPPQITHLVLSGGGLRGFAHVGALAALRDARGLDFGAGAPRLAVAAGCSIGGLLALLIVAGYTVDELLHLVRAARPQDLIRPDIARAAGGALSLDSGSSLRDWLSNLLRAKGLDPQLTLLDLQLKRATRWRAAVTNMQNGELVVVDAVSHPHTPVLDLALATAALPPVFPPVRACAQLWADGGLVDGFPIEALAGHAPAASVLGIVLRKTLRPPRDFEAAPFPLGAYIVHAVDVVSIPVDAALLARVPQALRDRVIEVRAPDVPLVEVGFHGVDALQRAAQNLVDAGRAAAQGWIAHC